MGDRGRAGWEWRESTITLTVGIAIGVVLAAVLGALISGWGMPFRIFGPSPRETVRNVNPIDLKGMELLRIDAEQVAAGDRTRTLEGLIRQLEECGKRHVSVGTSAYGKEPFPSISIGFSDIPNESPRLGAMAFTIAAGRTKSRTVVFTVLQFLPSGLDFGSRTLVWQTWLAEDTENDRLRHASEAVFRSNVVESICRELPALLDEVYVSAPSEERSRLGSLRIWVGGQPFEFRKLTDDNSAPLGDASVVVGGLNLAAPAGPKKRPRRRRPG